MKVVLITLNTSLANSVFLVLNSNPIVKLVTKRIVLLVCLLTTTILVLKNVRFALILNGEIIVKIVTIQFV